MGLLDGPGYHHLDSHQQHMDLLPILRQSSNRGMAGGQGGDQATLAQAGPSRPKPAHGQILAPVTSQACKLHSPGREENELGYHLFHTLQPHAL